MSVKKTKKDNKKKKSTSIAKKDAVQKKTTKKSAPKKPGNKKVVNKKKLPAKKQDKIMQTDIKNAVDKLPGLIVEQVKFEKEKLQPQKQPAKIREEIKEPVKNYSTTIANNNDRSKRRLLWLLVFTLTLVVFIMWFWNLTVAFKDVGRSSSTGSNLIGDVKESYENIMKTTLGGDEEKVEENKDDIDKDKVKDSLKASLLSLISNTSTTTTTFTTDTCEGEEFCTTTIDIIITTTTQ